MLWNGLFEIGRCRSPAGSITLCAVELSGEVSELGL